MSNLSQSSISPAKIEERLRIEELMQANLADDGHDVIKGLTQAQKSLPPHYFYDDQGSKLFEEICELPEYYPTRTETGILQQYAPEIALITGNCELIELGSGSSKKTRLLLDAYQTQGNPLRYLPIDVSAGILRESAKQLLKDYPTLEIHGLVATYELGLDFLGESPLPGRMMFFLGSTIGNFTASESDHFFSHLNQSLKPGEYFLLGMDLQKDQEIIEAAYNDSLGITAAFNLNMLTHLNKRFQGDFAVNLFKHWAFYNQAEQQIEMHLISKKSQKVNLEKLNLTIELAAEETILTEISRKFDLSQMQDYLQKLGFQPIQAWTDPQKWFGLLLFQIV